MEVVENPALCARIVGIPTARGGSADLPSRPRHVLGAFDPRRNKIDLGLQHGDERARLLVVGVAGHRPTAAAVTARSASVICSGTRGSSPRGWSWSWILTERS